MARAIFEEIFEGPESIFGRIFGPSQQAIDEAKKLVRKRQSRTIRFKLNQLQIERLQRGDQVTFTVGDEKFVIVREEASA